MERYQQLFTRLESSKEGAFVPFVTLGDLTRRSRCRLSTP